MDDNNLQAIKILTPKDFPPLLKEISDPPEKLYIKGKADFSGIFLTVVGSRKNSAYGIDVCRTLISGLSGFPITIVSGLALGIDSIAHKSALESGLKTIAVPGSGLSDEVLYPSTHLRLAKKIIENGGALLSEFEPNFRATPWSFPQRNRIMAGMSNAVLVIEAERQSGTLITSRLATEYNRDVLTIPGSIFSKNSEGPHMLIRLGATPITSVSDLREALGFKNNEKESKKQMDISSLSEKEKIVWNVLSTPISKDEIKSKTNLPINELSAVISMLEIKGLIKESMGEWRRN